MEPLLRGVAAEGYTTPTPIQAQAIPHVLEGRDLLGCAQTGTGKTAAFALPILHRLLARPTERPEAPASDGHRHRAGHKAPARKARVLVLAPTRELASQIGESFAAYGRFTHHRHVVIYGGVSQVPQAKALRSGVDIIVATPGRLMDLMGQGLVDLCGIEVLVLDEADRMLDMGFLPDVRRIVAQLPHERQSLLFSATMPADIRELAKSVLRDPVSVQAAAVSSAADTVEQSVYLVDRRRKPQLLEHVLQQSEITRALVFTRTKHGADRVVRQLDKAGIRSEAIHGDKTQTARQRALENFRRGRTRVLIATDVAARGLDVDDISHVINYDLPNIAETYVHRIGRTGRAGSSGKALSFCDGDERSHLRSIEQLLRKAIRVERPELPAELVIASDPPKRHPGGAKPASRKHGRRKPSNKSSFGGSPRGNFSKRPRRRLKVRASL
jgi:ATP-dependent RNA helicase RhlE